jgi:hypothetical protein
MKEQFWVVQQAEDEMGMKFCSHFDMTCLGVIIASFNPSSPQLLQFQITGFFPHNLLEVPITSENKRIQIPCA